MGGVMLLLLLCSLVLAELISGFSLSPSPSAAPPIEQGISSSVSHGKVFSSAAPAPAFELNGTSSPPANVFPPSKEVLSPSLQPIAPTILPPPSSAPPPVTSVLPPFASPPAPPPPLTWNVAGPVLPPRSPNREHRHTENPVPMPAAPAPVSSPGKKLPDNAPTKAPQLPESMPPIPSESRAPESPPLTIAPVLNMPPPRGKLKNSLPTLPRNPEVSPSTPPVQHAPAPRGNPQNPLPTKPIIPEISPSIPPVLNAPAPRGKPQKPLPARPSNPEVSPSMPPVAPPPRKLPNNSLTGHPRLPVKPPSVSPELISGFSLSPSPSAAPPIEQGISSSVSHGKVFSSAAPAPAFELNGTSSPPANVFPPPKEVLSPSLQPVAPPILPPPSSAPPPVTSVLPPFASPPAPPPPLTWNGAGPVLPPRSPNREHRHTEQPVPVPAAPAPVSSPGKKLPDNAPTKAPQLPGSMPPIPSESRAPESPPLTIAPVLNMPPPRGKPKNSLPTLPRNPEVSPSTPPVQHAPAPRGNPQNPLPTKPIIPEISPSIPPVLNAPAPRGKPQKPLPARPSNPEVSPSMPLVAPPPRKLPNNSLTGHPRLPVKPPSVSPVKHDISPVSTPWPSINRKTASAPAVAPANGMTNKHPGKGALVSPLLAPLTSPENHDSHAISPSPAASSRPTKMPFLSPKKSPSGSSPRHPKIPHPLHALPPPPPNEDCASLACAEPFTNGPPKAPCVCVLPMRVGLRLSVALYTFFPLVSELATEIAVGVFMDPSQVRIMGANSASQYPEKTIVLIDLVPLGEKFDNTTAFLTSQRFWHKQVAIKASYFGDYDVLYVQYPGLPPSPPSADSDNGIGSRPYPGDNNGRTIKPLGVDVRQQHKNGTNRSIIAVIVLSASVAVILCCAVAWVLLFRHRDSACQSAATPPTTLPSLAKSSGIGASMIGSRPNSPSVSFSSSFAAYTGSAKTFSSGEIERATDNLNEARVLGEGGFGRVYGGVLDDGMKVAVKVLKRDDQQGGREFLAEVEMLSRLHHRNLVKLIGICLEERSRCLVYELMPNGSVESHLHGIDKEISPLDWNARMKIALGAARGLAYLHEDSSPRVIHRDFKSSNILLEHDFTPKVSDFGLARAALDEENRHISTRVMGTFGYVAPEYAMTGHLLVKSDVYSYGVVLLELLTGRKPVDMSQPPGQENLVSWARPILTSEEGLQLIVDPTLGPDFPFDDIVKVAAIASMCVQPEVSHRPFMGEVVQALKLVCNECEQTKEFESQSCSQDDLSFNMDARISTASGQLLNPIRPQSPVSNSDSELDVERGLSMSDLLSPLARYGKQESDSFRRNSSSGPFRTGKTRRLWQKMRRLSGGSLSEHRVTFGLWPGSH